MASKDARRHGVDPILLFCIIGLTLFGLIAITSASSVLADKFRGDVLFFFKHQMLYGGFFGLIVFMLGMYTPYKHWRILALPAILVSTILLVMVFIPGLRLEYGGAARWIGIGPITIQPTEITKLAFILYLSALMSVKGDDVRNFKKSVVPFLVIIGVISSLIVLQPDIGTLISIVIIGISMVYVAGFRLRHLLLMGLGGVAAFGVLINTAAYRLNRIIVYLHPELDPQGVGYQINQALLAVGTGGLWGLGFGRSRQKYHYLPEPAGDSIFAVIAEELGFIRTSLILLVFATIAYRGYAVARKVGDPFGKLLATGITTWIVSQAFINVGSILALTPMTGIPLPFISYGGSSLVTMLLAAGVLLNISRYTER